MRKRRTSLEDDEIGFDALESAQKLMSPDELFAAAQSLKKASEKRANALSLANAPEFVPCGAQMPTPEITIISHLSQSASCFARHFSLTVHQNEARLCIKQTRQMLLST